MPHPLTSVVRITIVLLLTAILFWLIFNAELVVYGVRQLRGQLELVWNAVPVEEYITANPDSTDNIRKLQYLQTVRAYAMDSLGLHSSDNYTTFYDHGRKPLMWVVTASKPFSMEAHEWTFPFLGSLSYKGFFREELALEEAAQVRKEGYETDIYNPSAWSTLGWMNDPILSGMLHKGPGQLAELIIHELTHATVFLPGQVEYNENLATFIGEQGALLFLSSHFGTNSPEKIRYENFLHDQIIYAKHLLKGAESLDSLYKTFTSDELISSRAEKKYRLISSIFLNINYLPLKEPKRYLFDFRQEQLPGNTTFMAYRRYRKDQAELYKLLNEEYEGDLRKMIAGLSEK